MLVLVALKMMILQKRTRRFFASMLPGNQPTKSINIWKFYADDGDDEALTNQQMMVENHILVLYAYRHPTILYYSDFQWLTAAVK